MNPEVIVVGAGPVGLLLAGILAGDGLEVTVLEQREQPTTESRASTLHAATMSTLSRLGLLDRLGPLASGGPGHFGGLRLDLEQAQPDHPFAGQWKCAQTHLEAVLQAWARERGATVLRGHRVTGVYPGPEVTFVRTNDAAVGRFTAEYVVGCDGEESSVRQLAGFATDEHAATLEMLRADVSGIQVRDQRFERHPDGLATAHRWPDGSTRVMVHVFGTAAARRSQPPDFGEVVAAWAKVTGEDLGRGHPLWLNAFGNRSLQVRTYRQGNVFVAGDAAHVQMPVGGQALNLGLADAAVLGPLLAEAVQGGKTDRLADYHRIRHPIGARALTGIRAQAQLLLSGPEIDPLRAVVGDLLRVGEVQQRLARSITGLGRPTQGEQ